MAMSWSTLSGESRQASPYMCDSMGGDSDESWQFLDYMSGTASSAAASVRFWSSPASASLSGYGMVGHASSSSPHAMSDLKLSSAGHSPQLGQQRQVGSAAASRAFMTPRDYLFCEEWTERDTLTQRKPGSSSTPLIMTMPPEALPSVDLSISPEVSGEELHLSSNALGIMLPGRAKPKGQTQGKTQGKVQGTSDTETKSPRLAVRKARRARTDNSSTKTRPPSLSPRDAFVIMTPQSMGAHQGRLQGAERREGMRGDATQQRGRKGPLASTTKESALLVRRRGACFCCHSRKVKCEMARPCRQCRKLMQQVPQLVCWQFQDFNAALFPHFIRAHFRRDAVARFVRESVDEFRVRGAEVPCCVELSSGLRLAATLELEALFFTKTGDALQHWHATGHGGLLQVASHGAAPIGLVPGSGASREGLRKAIKAYVDAIVDDACFVEQATDSLRSTQLPAKVLGVVHRYGQQSGADRRQLTTPSQSPMVKRALSIYAMHYIMTRHLCMTQRCTSTLRDLGLVAQNTTWVTSRVLTRQVKALIDELMMETVQRLFDLFSRSLKPKSRREWAPCTAAFLVLCLFIEAVETTTEGFVAAQRQVDQRNHSVPQYAPDFALRMCRELENMPFKQFAYQFHNIYQTHSKDANTSSFNPLFDARALDNDELDGPDLELVAGLRELLHGESWQDLQFLADDDLVLGKPQSFPIDPAYIYTGRLVSKFLLSFANEQILFEGRL